MGRQLGTGTGLKRGNAESEVDSEIKIIELCARKPLNQLSFNPNALHSDA